MQRHTEAPKPRPRNAGAQEDAGGLGNLGISRPGRVVRTANVLDVFAWTGAE
jgi:hypothetical protein